LSFVSHIMFSFSSYSIDKLHQKDSLIRILNSSLDAVDPYYNVRNSLHREGNILTAKNKRYDLNKFRRIHVFGFGKATLPMGRAIEDILLGDYDINGCLITKLAGYKPISMPKALPVFFGNHPVPGEESIQSSLKLLGFMKEVKKEDLVICLISGGGSALLTLPKEPVLLNELKELTRLLLDCGATINEINTLRKHLEVFKGGGLARLLKGTTIISLILSDVIGNPLDVIASGPTSADLSTFTDCMRILEKYSLAPQIPGSILKVLQDGENGKLDESAKIENEFLDNVNNCIIGDNSQAVKRAVETAKTEGFNSILLMPSIVGEARTAGENLAGILRLAGMEGYPVPRPACIVAGGETTVTIRGKGKGGRNQEVALGAVKALRDLNDVALIVLATDGEDGPTDACGAVVTGDTFNRGVKLGLDVDEFLSQNDAYNYFDRLGDLLKTGSTGTNVNDLLFLFAL
jgi:glycerate 2-kinase